jgi:phosphoribosylamine--glycine ligase
MVDRVLGSAGDTVVVEEILKGQELSVFALVDDHTIYALESAQDHKAIGDGDTGGNTGGMGAYSPAPIATASVLSFVERDILVPIVDALRNDGAPYRGLLYVGLMLTAAGPKVLEFNCRFGDPETQVLLPLIDGDLGEILKKLAQGKIVPYKQKNLFASCVVMAAPGYPMNPEKNLRIDGNLNAATELSYFLHAGTKKNPDGQWLTSGGRVLNAVGLGASFKESLEKAYQQSTQAQWMGLQKRSDIGSKI